MGVIDDLKRLERTAQESSATNRKLIEAASRVMQQVIYAVETVRPEFPLPDEDRLELAGGYLAGYVDASMLGEDQPGYEPPDADGSHSLKLRVEKPHGASYIDGEVCGVECARMIARDVATGWLAELADWVQKRAQEDEALVSSIEETQKFKLADFKRGGKIWPKETIAWVTLFYVKRMTVILDGQQIHSGRIRKVAS